MIPPPPVYVYIPFDHVSSVPSHSIFGSGKPAFGCLEYFLVEHQGSFVKLKEIIVQCLDLLGIRGGYGQSFELNQCLGQLLYFPPTWNTK